MARKVYIMENLGCANCAAKMEEKFNALPEVEEATITFATKQLRLSARDPDALVEKLTRIARSVEQDVYIRDRDAAPMEHHHEHGEGCGCGHHHHEHEEECGCGHHHHEHGEECGCGHHHHEHGEEQEHVHHYEQGRNDEKISLLLGAGLFALGLIFGWMQFEAGAWAAFVAGYLVLGWEILATAWRNLRGGHMLDENFLMSLASLGAFAIGEASEAVGVMLFYRVGEYFEHRAVERSRSQIMEAVDLRPEVVYLTDGRTIPAAEAKVGDLLLVRPGDRIPLDGVVVSGESRIDTAPITGEPVPVRVASGDGVVSGCVNTTGQLTVEVRKELRESMVTRILDSVENAAASKPKIDRFITKFARIYTPVVVALAVMVAVVPSIVTGNWNYWVYTALSFLVMSCPCALVLSVPLAFFAGIGAGSRKGILFKGGLSMEAMGKVKTVVMDKTGTITRGDFRVQQVVGGDEMLQLCASCEQQSSHPIAVSIVDDARQKQMALMTPQSLEEIPGRGIRAVVAGKRVLCGNEKLLMSDGVTASMPECTGTVVLVAVDGVYAGYLVIADTVKEDAKQAIAQLKAQGFSTVMLTGDNEEIAHQIAAQTGIEDVKARLLPDEKLEALQQIRNERGAVMYVGDGINDAPVLAGADVGAAMGSGADAAIEAADVVFMTSQVGAIAQSLHLAKQTARIAKENVVFALAVKLLVMVLGLTGHASMWMAVFADSGVAMLCVLNSIRMLYRKK